MPTPPKSATPSDTCIPATPFLRKRLGVRGVGLLAVLLAIAVTGNQWRQSFHKVSEAQKQENCLVNMKQISLAFLQYAQDNDNRLPEARHWMTVTRPYIKNPHAYHCPDALDSHFGYAFNNSLSDLNIDKPQSPSTLILTYDSTATTANATDHVTSLPQPERHWGLDTASFADGHAKLVRYSDVLPARSSAGNIRIDP